MHEGAARGARPTLEARGSCTREQRAAPAARNPLRPQNDLAEVVALLEQLVRRLGLPERQHAIDDGMNRAALEIGAEAREEARDDPGLLLDGAPAQRRADDREPLRDDGAEVDLRARSAHQPDQHEPASEAKALEVLLEIRRADRVEHGVDSPAGRRLEDVRRERSLAVVERDVRAELATARALLRAARGHERAHAGAPEQLNRRGADPAPTTVHES